MFPSRTLLVGDGAGIDVLQDVSEQLFRTDLIDQIHCLVEYILSQFRRETRHEVAFGGELAFTPLTGFRFSVWKDMPLLTFMTSGLKGDCSAKLKICNTT